MKTFKELLIKLDACKPARDWADCKTIEEIVATCHRGDWQLWLAHELGVGIRLLTLAKARCAKTVINLMNDQKSIDAVIIAERFGLGLATIEELNIAAVDAVDTADAAYAAAYAAAAYATDAAAYATDAAAAADAAYAAAYAAYLKNQLETANICRELLGNIIIEKVNELLKSNE